MVWLLLASCFFYMSWKPWLILLILFSASVDYFVALRLAEITTLWKRRALLIASISTNLSLLFSDSLTSGITCVLDDVPA
jgi:alginate O-acetyltransferase complex protein AlgI